MKIYIKNTKILSEKGWCIVSDVASPSHATDRRSSNADNAFYSQHKIEKTTRWEPDPIDPFKLQARKFYVSAYEA